MIRLLVLATIVLAVARTSCADVIVLKDGRGFEGLITEETPRTMEIDCVVHGIRSRLRFDRIRIRSFQRKPLPPGFFGPTREQELTAGSKLQVVRYTVFPLRGGIGEAVQAEDLEYVLRGVRGKSDYIILDVDTPGGSVREGEELAEVIARFDEVFHFVALVHRGASAAVFPVFACDSIYLRNGGIFGGAVTHQLQSDTGVPEFDAKANSLMAAKVASIADRKGWSPAIARAMVIPEASLVCWPDARGAPAVGDAAPDRQADVIVLDGPDTVLTISGDIAVACGFPEIVNTGATPDDLGSRLVPGRDWRPGSRAGITRHKRATHNWEVFLAGLGERQGLRQAASASMHDAEASDPERYEYTVKTFTIWSSTGPSPRVVTKPTPASWEKWYAYTDSATAAWRRAVEALDRLMEIESRTSYYHESAMFSLSALESERAHCEQQIRRLLRLRPRGPR